MPNFGAAAILGGTSTLLFILVFDLGRWSEGPPDDPAPWLDYFWMGSGLLSLLLAFYVEKMEQRTAANGQDEQAVESNGARLIPNRGKSSSDAAYTPAE